MSNPTLFLATISFLLVLVPVFFYCAYRVHRNLQERADAEIELIGHVRLVMQDLLSRDPQIAETIEVSLLELDKWERDACRMTGGLASPWGFRKPGTTS